MPSSLDGRNQSIIDIFIAGSFTGLCTNLTEPFAWVGIKQCFGVAGWPTLVKVPFCEYLPIHCKQPNAELLDANLTED